MFVSSVDLLRARVCHLLRNVNVFRVTSFTALVLNDAGTGSVFYLKGILTIVVDRTLNYVLRAIMT